MDHLLTMNEACERLTVSRPRLYELAARHGVRFTVVDGRRYLSPVAVARLEELTADRLLDGLDATEDRRWKRRFDGEDPVTRIDFYVGFVEALWVLVLFPIFIWLAFG